jgi:hypothetical protein
MGSYKYVPVLTNFPVRYSFAEDGIYESACRAFAFGPCDVDYVQSIEVFRLHQRSVLLSRIPPAVGEEHAL